MSTPRDALPSTVNHSNGTNAQSNPEGIAIFIPPASSAENNDLIARLNQLINEVYKVAEEGIFGPEYSRTNPEEVKDFLRTSQLALASTLPEQSYKAEDVIGTIRIIKHSATTYEFGVLTTDPAYRRNKTGLKLVQFAEAHVSRVGANKLQLGLLMPTTFEHKVKSLISPWYERLGYKIVGKEDFGKSYPRLKPLLCTGCEYRWFEKDVQNKDGAFAVLH